jgi:serine/threonine protein kinase
MENNLIRDEETMMVTKVEKLEPLPLRKKWMNDLAQAVAFLESLKLAHGDLRPENILLDHDRLKLSDFDCTAEIGSEFEACVAPYGRILNSNEVDEGPVGSSGFLGPRTEQFALGSLYYLINYGFEGYGNQRLTETPKEHGRKVVELLQNMEFPDLDGDPLIDDIIDHCWHNEYATVAELAACTEALVTERTNDEASSRRESNGGSCGDVDLDNLTEEFFLTKVFCQVLVKRGLLNLLSSGEPIDLGFTFEGYRLSNKDNGDG